MTGSQLSRRLSKPFHISRIRRYRKPRRDDSATFLRQRHNRPILAEEVAPNFYALSELFAAGGASAQYGNDKFAAVAVRCVRSMGY
jgi:hypothetical protein